MRPLEKEKLPTLPVVDPAVPGSPPGPTRSRTKRSLVVAAGIITLLLFIFSRSSCSTEFDIPESLRFLLPSTGTNRVKGVKSGVPKLGVPEKIQRRWGQYSPYFPAGKYVSPPASCVIDQVNILQRHGARYPNKDDDYEVAIERLQSAKKLHDDLKFLKEYEYTLGEEDLIAFGAQQSFEAGQQAYERYSYLLATTLPFIRASGIQRVVDSAGNWSRGFLPPHFLGSPHLPPDAPLPIQIISENVNNTLNDDCPNAPSEEKYTDQWLRQFAPSVIHRLKKMAEGVELEDEDVHRLIGVCVFETISDGSQEMRGMRRKAAKSPFCDLFTPKNWKEWEYWGNVEKYYKTGYGNPLGPVRGVGYVNELLARLTQSKVADHTQHNYSLPFPLDRALYADFTHENLMIAVYSVLGLFNVSTPLDPKKMPKDMDREWLASRMVPFSARMVVERLQCLTPPEEVGGFEGRQVNPHWSPRLLAGAAEDVKSRKHGTKSGTFVRIFVNDDLQPLEFCSHDVDRQSAHWQKKHSLCTLGNFVDSQHYARSSGDGDLEKCYN
ncbi:uncharacterized protein PHACADRAFT_205786 [Phanerochaete carnosa HHB-10118-sp]|uniref:3-phytase n=1 Tax=Phanerochaete carnosa (strain HHB-10118-sp) TaxID=650164 RepID=K5X9I9_PHACS|nr:uncharacterized protein PHACADRAFT_205786 [Phanerochaete carnosa HHB-10118-sp]EKM59567.1 hypothetical protein PHACADRAFT_205786 [Phanerochaete carnosa HHB-10118-sp]